MDTQTTIPEKHKKCNFLWHKQIGIALAIVLLPALPVYAQETGQDPLADPTVGETVAEAPAEEAVMEEAVVAEEVPADTAAIAFMMKCMGCHTLGGGALSGPDLKPTAGWPVNNLRDAVIRMEKNVGPMSQEEIETFTQYLLDTEAANRLAAEQQRAALQQAASMEPGSAEVGAALFMGQRPFQNGGLSCASCHQAAGKGGNLAVSLEEVFTRMGEVPLISACEKPGFPVMRTIYAQAPLSKQEAVHVVKFLEEVSVEPQAAATVPLHLIGLIGGVLVMVLLGKSTSKRAAGTRARMVAEAHRKSNLGGAGR